VILNQADSLEGKDKEKHLGLNFLYSIGCRGIGEYFESVRECRASLGVAV